MIIADIVELSNAVLVTTSQTFHNKHNSATSFERINNESRQTVGNVSLLHHNDNGGLRSRLPNETVPNKWGQYLNSFSDFRNQLNHIPYLIQLAGRYELAKLMIRECCMTMMNQYCMAVSDPRTWVQSGPFADHAYCFEIGSASAVTYRQRHWSQ